MFLFEGKTADEVWTQALEHLLEKRSVFQDGRRERTVELLHVAMSVSEPRNRWVTSRHPPMNPAFGIAELIWILTGSDDAAFLTYWNSRLPEFSGPGPTLSGAYGHRLRRHFGVDQLERASKALANNPDTRQVVLQIWDPTVDLPDDLGVPADPDIPCNLISILKVRDGRLDWFQVLRSNDLLLGLPYNMLQFMTLQEVMAGWIGVEPGVYNQMSDSLHIYESNLDLIAQSTVTAPDENTDSLLLSREESVDALEQVDRAARRLTEETTSEDDVRKAVEAFDGPGAYRNWLLVLSAESARRRRWPALVDEMASQISNPVLAQVWSRWLDRFSASPGHSSPVQPSS